MAISRIKLPDNSTQDLHDYRITGIDVEPTSNSSNLVTSGGVKTYVDSVIGDIETLLNNI